MADGRLQVAGQLAILGAVLQVIGLFPAYKYDEPVAVIAPGVQWYVLIVAAISVAAGVCLHLPRTRRLIGPGLLLGVVVAAIGEFLSLLADPLMQDGYQTAWGISLVAYLVLLSAACLAGLALARDGEVRLVRRLLEHPLTWIVVLLGVVAAVELVVLIQQLRAESWGWWLGQFVWAAATALVVPALGAAALPRQFGAALLVGWAGGGVAICIFRVQLMDYLLDQGLSKVGSGPFVVLGLTLFALLVVAVLLARIAPASQAGHARDTG